MTLLVHKPVAKDTIVYYTPTRALDTDTRASFDGAVSTNTQKFIHGQDRGREVEIYLLQRTKESSTSYTSHTFVRPWNAVNSQHSLRKSQQAKSSLLRYEESARDSLDQKRTPVARS